MLFNETKVPNSLRRCFVPQHDNVEFVVFVILSHSEESYLREREMLSRKTWTSRASA